MTKLQEAFCREVSKKIVNAVVAGDGWVVSDALIELSDTIGKFDSVAPNSEEVKKKFLDLLKDCHVLCFEIDDEEDFNLFAFDSFDDSSIEQFKKEAVNLWYDDLDDFDDPDDFDDSDDPDDPGGSDDSGNTPDGPDNFNNPDDSDDKGDFSFTCLSALIIN